MRIVGHSAATGNDVYDVVVDGESYKYEVWSTENSSGAEWYDATGARPVDDPITEDQTTEFEARIDAYVQLFYPLWQEKVEPVITEIVTTVIARLDQASTCRHCGMLVWHDGTSWVDATVGDGCNEVAVHEV